MSNLHSQFPLKTYPIKQARTYRQLFIYFLKFGAAFCILYFGTLAVIGLSARENQYSPFVANYLNFINPLRTLLLLTSKGFLALLGYRTFLSSEYILSMEHGSSIRMVYSCIGYGVLSFWGAFVFANKGTWQKKISWIAAGWIVLCVINVMRVSILLIATNNHWSIPFGWDHHTWFNIIAYSFIFGMIYFYDRSSKKVEPEVKT